MVVVFYRASKTSKDVVARGQGKMVYVLLMPIPMATADKLEEAATTFKLLGKKSRHP